MMFLLGWFSGCATFVCVYFGVNMLNNRRYK